jgi:hypothetical protein
MTSREDYAQTGFTISEAMIDLSTRYPDKDVRPDHVVWGGLLIKTADCSSVPTRGILKLDILSRKTEVDQGVDLNIKDGAFRLRGGEEVSLKILLNILIIQSRADCMCGMFTKSNSQTG